MYKKRKIYIEQGPVVQSSIRLTLSLAEDSLSPTVVIKSIVIIFL